MEGKLIFTSNSNPYRPPSLSLISSVLHEIDNEGLKKYIKAQRGEILVDLKTKVS